MNQPDTSVTTDANVVRDTGHHISPDASADARDVAASDADLADLADLADTGPDSTFIRLRIPAGAVGSTLLPFVTLVDGRHDLLQQLAPDATYLRFVTSPNRIPLRYEVESYDADRGRLRAWVRLNAVQADSDNDFLLEIAPEPFEPHEPDRTWNSSWRGVWHMEDSSHAGGSQIRDSSQFENHGTANLTDSPPAEGQIGRAISMDGIDDYIRVPVDQTLEPPLEVTLSAWVYDEMVDTGGIISKPATSIGPSYNNSYQMWIDNSLRTSGVVATNGELNEYPGDVFPNGSWQFVAVTYDGNELRVYRNGTMERSEPVTGELQYDGADLYIGADINGGEVRLRLAALIDEARISAVAAEPDRVTAWYDNQSDPASFVLWDP